MTPKPRAALYARYSSDLQNDKGIDDQFAIGRAYAAQRGYEVTATFHDEAMSSMELGRPGLHALLQAAESGRFDVLISENPDRVSRDGEHLFGIYKRLTHHKVVLDTVQDGVATVLSVAVRCLTGSVFSGDLSRRVSSRMREQARSGRILGRAAYGYRDVPGKPGEKEIDPAQAEVVRRIYRLYIGGMSPRSIARMLNEEGVPAPGRTPWQGQNLATGATAFGPKGILANPLYAGVVRFGRKRNARHPVTGRIVTQKSDDLVEVEVERLRIVDEATWDAAQRMRDERALSKGHAAAGSGKARAVPRKDHLFAGLLRCPCGAPMISAFGHPRYGARIMCSDAHAEKGCAHKRSYALWRLEKGIIAGLGRALSDETAIAAALARVQERRSERQKRARAEDTTIRRRLAEIDGTVMQLVSLVSVGGSVAERVRVQLEALETERVGLEESLRLAAEELQVTELKPEVIARYRELVATLPERMKDPKRLPKLRVALRSLIEQIVVHEVPLRAPLEFSIEGRLGGILGLTLEPNQRDANQIVRDNAYLGFPKQEISHITLPLGRFTSRAA